MSDAVIFVRDDGTRVGAWFDFERVRRGELFWFGTPKKLYRITRVERMHKTKIRAFVSPEKSVLPYDDRR